MGLLDRFKKKKEQELAGETAVDSSSDKIVEGAPAKKKAPAKKAVNKEAAESKKPAKSVKVVGLETSRVILAPLVTEKAAHLSAARTYVFRVDRRSTRSAVATAFKELYGVQPMKVNIVNVRGEPVRFGRREGRQAAWKKAMITVPVGKEIQVYENV